jgi:hypothetical protein
VHIVQAAEVAAAVRRIETGGGGDFVDPVEKQGRMWSRPGRIGAEYSPVSI